MKVTVANKGPLITKTGFKNYDVGMNPYVGCQFGCKYCYVRFMVKDEEPWGDFVRLRKHIATKLPKEIAKLNEGTRLVLGTMTDPYQPIERKERLTRTTLELIAGTSKFAKVGIFTRSPFVLDDRDLIRGLPSPRVHFTITPYAEPILKKIEPVAIPIRKRLETIREIQKAGIRVQANISPILPIFSDPYIEETIATLADIGVQEFYLDPMQSYKEAITAMDESFGDHEEWKKVRQIVTDPQQYRDWKVKNREACIAYWKKHGNGSTLAIWQDHVSKFTIDMRTSEELDRNRYGEDAK